MILYKIILFKALPSIINIVGMLIKLSDWASFNNSIII